MALDLSTLKTTGSQKLPPRLIIYGPHGLGKTSLAAEFPAPVMLDLEKGAPAGVEIPSLGDVESWEHAIDAMIALHEQEHDFKTLIVDSLDRLEHLAQAHVCKLNKWKSIEDPGYGKGYVIAADTLRTFMDACNSLRAKRGMNIVYLAHSQIVRFDDPQAASYSKYEIRLHKAVTGMFGDDADAILFVNQDVSVQSEDVGFKKTVNRADGGGFRWIYCEARPSFNAKNRFNMPARLKYDKGKGFDALAPFLPVANTSNQKKEKDANNG